MGRPTVASLASRVDEQDAKLDAILQAVSGASEQPAEQPQDREEQTTAKAAAATPDHTFLMREQVRNVKTGKVSQGDPQYAVGRDPKYPRNVALYRTSSDGTILTNKEGNPRKPVRIPADALLALIGKHEADASKLAEQIVND